jgi:phosphoglycolate phosphatase
MKYTLAIFDLDGTILDTLDDLADTINFALSNSGFPKRTRDEVRRFVGNGINRLVERAVPADTSPEEAKKVRADFEAHYKAHCAIKTRPYDGIIEILKTLRESGVKAAVVSNKPDFAVKDLCELYFPGMLDFAVGEREGVRRKPAPDSVLTVLEKLSTDSKKAVFIGDSDVDIETARNAGIDCISVDWGFRSREFLLESGASTIISSPDELLNLII